MKFAQPKFVKNETFCCVPEHQSVLDEGEEDEENAIDHPDVERLDVADAGRALAHGGEHGRQGEQGGHADGHATWHALRWHQK